MEEFSKDPNQEKLQKILQMLTTIPEQVETALQKIQREICHTFTREIQVKILVLQENLYVVISISAELCVISDCDKSLDLSAHDHNCLTFSRHYNYTSYWPGLFLSYIFSY